MTTKPVLNKDTRVCISLAGRPTDLGTRFHNSLYAELGLDFLYKAFSTVDLEGAVRGVRALGFRGCSVSMPFKTAIIPMLDAIGLTDNGRIIILVRRILCRTASRKRAFYKTRSSGALVPSLLSKRMVAPLATFAFRTSVMLLAPAALRC